ncbi:unnamed protein product [Rhodiola kirilowii]
MMEIQPAGSNIGLKMSRPVGVEIKKIKSSEVLSRPAQICLPIQPAGSQAQRI